MSISRVVVACIAMVAEVHASVNWGLAGARQSCTAYCNEKNEACTPGHWPTDAYQMLRVAIAVQHTKCTNVRLSQKANAPSVTTNVSGDTECHYNLEVGDTAPMCSQAPEGITTQRFCPCSASGLRWYLSAEGQSCRDTCRVKGGICGDESTVWPTSQVSMEAVASYVGIECKTYKMGTAGFTPSIGTDGTCHFGSSTPGQTAFCDAADWTNSHQKRICPCWDVA